jgi:hypothetical protein
MASQPISIKGITGLGIAELEPTLEPTHPLGRSPMGKSVWHHVSLRLSLDPVIPDCAGSVQPFLDVSDLEDLAAFIGLMGPSPCEAVSLQFHHHG